ncbi:unnamed protein product [Caenorhabditis angaria]|uniref:RRM domain-containing protein n=1 Tax=Caenorhabditis angaria TaxID=860376 RepID=A0A9P1ITZ0_9PELO|nr:unnamed protein product [Caenorhabditis angaria]
MSQDNYRRPCKHQPSPLNLEHLSYENLFRYQQFLQTQQQQQRTITQEEWNAYQTWNAIQKSLTNSEAPMYYNQNPLETICMTPSPSESRSSHHSMSMYNLLESVSPYQFEQQPQSPQYPRPTFENIPPQQPEEHRKIFTADTVHSLVKTSRDNTKPRVVSNKVFVGRVNPSMERSKINNFFAKFGDVFVDWPVKMTKNGNRKSLTSYSYLFLVYSDESSVLKLMEDCMNPSTNNYYVNVPESRDDVIQIRPWFLHNAFYIHPSAREKSIIDIHRTVFVGGLPRIVTAKEIAELFGEFGRVLLVTIDLDQDYGYPKGAARVVFEKDSSFANALERKYLSFKDIDSSKTQIEIKPYVLEDAGCDQCGGLWFNPFIDIIQHLNDSNKRRIKQFDIWGYNGLFTNHLDNDFSSSLSINTVDENDDSENRDLRKGCAEFLKAARQFKLDDNPKTVWFNGVEYLLGPDYWALVMKQPNLGINHSEQSIESRIQTRLTLKKDKMYGNKSNYCKDKPCRQYYCSSCSHHLHSGTNHSLLPTGKPERRPRKDKNMYFVQNHNNPNKFHIPAHL